jgi:hypothetical protein
MQHPNEYLNTDHTLIMRDVYVAGLLGLPSPSVLRTAAIAQSIQQGPDARGSISDSGRDFSPPHTVQTGSGTHPASGQVARIQFLGQVWWSYTSTPPHFMACCLIKRSFRQVLLSSVNSAILCRKRAVLMFPLSPRNQPRVNSPHKRSVKLTLCLFV